MNNKKIERVFLIFVDVCQFLKCHKNKINSENADTFLLSSMQRNYLTV